MNNTISIYDERKNEIEFYYSVLLEIDEGNRNAVNTINNALFFRILKSNFLLMLYNIVEATITTGMLEIYEKLKNEECTYSDLINELQNIWRDYKIQEVYSPSSGLKVYTKKVKNIVKNIIEDTPLIFNKSYGAFME